MAARWTSPPGQVAPPDRERQVVVQVGDSGTGIAPEHLPRIFDPFFTTKGCLGQSDMPGTGLGLSVSHGIISAHGGAIEARSELGSGTLVKLYLPVLAAPRQEQPQPQPEPEPQEQARPTGALRVLVVDDEPDIRELVARVLRGNGYDVLTADGCAQAEEALTAQQFDLVISDWLMPNGGGKQIANLLSSLPDSPPLVIITGHVETDTEDDVTEVPLTRLQKPFGIADLLKAASNATAGCG